NELKKEKWYKSSRFISREEGMKEMAASNDSAFMQYVELNALPLSLELYFKAEFASAAQLESISGRLRKLQIIESVIYQKNLLETVNSNVAKIQLTLLDEIIDIILNIHENRPLFIEKVLFFQSSI
ncbi:MAG: permease-like cell division protein FtsX, partial [Dolichospermum sp.]